MPSNGAHAAIAMQNNSTVQDTKTLKCNVVGMAEQQIMVAKQWLGH